MPRFCLLAPAQMHGAFREPGYEFDLAEGERGPHRAVVVAHELVDVASDSSRAAPAVIDMPVFCEAARPMTLIEIERRAKADFVTRTKVDAQPPGGALAAKNEADKDAIIKALRAQIASLCDAGDRQSQKIRDLEKAIRALPPSAAEHEKDSE